MEKQKKYEIFFETMRKRPVMITHSKHEQPIKFPNFLTENGGEVNLIYTLSAPQIGIQKTSIQDALISGLKRIEFEMSSDSQSSRFIGSTWIVRDQHVISLLARIAKKNAKPSVFLLTNVDQEKYEVELDPDGTFQSHLTHVDQLVRSFVLIRGTPIHAKIFWFPNKVILTSANLTSGGLKDNFEVGLEFKKSDVVIWFRDFLSKLWHHLGEKVILNGKPASIRSDDNSRLVPFRLPSSSMTSLPPSLASNDFHLIVSDLLKKIVDAPTIKDALLKGIKSSEKTIRLATYKFADDDICRALIDKAEEGVNIKILLPTTSAISSYGRNETSLLRARRRKSIDVKSSPQPLVHAKFLIIDEKWVYLWTGNVDMYLKKGYDIGVKIGKKSFVKDFKMLFDFVFSELSSSIFTSDQILQVEKVVTTETIHIFVKNPLMVNINGKNQTILDLFNMLNSYTELSDIFIHLDDKRRKGSILIIKDEKNQIKILFYKSKPRMDEERNEEIEIWNLDKVFIGRERNNRIKSKKSRLIGKSTRFNYQVNYLRMIFIFNDFIYS